MLNPVQLTYECRVVQGEIKIVVDYVDLPNGSGDRHPQADDTAIVIEVLVDGFRISLRLQDQIDLFAALSVGSVSLYIELEWYEQALTWNTPALTIWFRAMAKSLAVYLISNMVIG